VALRRVGALVVLTGTIALAWVLLSATARTASASVVCTEYYIPGSWDFVLTDARLDFKVNFQEDRNGLLTGELIFTPDQVARFGYPPETRFPITSGHITGDRVTFEDTPTQPKTDGTGTHVGIYDGIVSIDSVANAHINGQTRDKLVPGSGVRFSARGSAACRSFSPGPPAVAPTPTAFDVPVPVQGQPGIDTAVGSPPIGNAMEASATADGITSNDRLTAALATGQLRHVCFLNFVKGISNVKKAELEANNPIAPAIVELADCLVLVDAIDAYLKAHPSAALARASPCAQFQVSVPRHRGRRVTVRVTHVGPVPKETVSATCTFSGGRATMTLRSNKRGTPLRKLIGPRLQIGVFRSRLDPPGGHPTVRFTRR
jgi:hypothetical protein